MSQIEAIRAALQAATRTLTMHGVQMYLSQWIADEARERPPVTRTSLWLVLLDRMEGLAETCRWWGVRP